MTRRRIVFKDEKEVWVSPEFNSDKKEFADEEKLVEHFAGITSAMQFRIACHDVMREYQSALSNVSETEGPFLLTNKEEMPKADEVVIIDIKAAKEKYSRYCSCVNDPIAWQKWCEVVMTLR